MVFGQGSHTWSWTQEMNEGGIFSLPSLLWRPMPSSLIPGWKSCFWGSSPDPEHDLEVFRGGWFAWAGGGQRSRRAGTVLGVGDTVLGSWPAPGPPATSPEPTGTRLAVTVMEAKPLCWPGHCFGRGESDGDMVPSEDAWIWKRLGSSRNVLLRMAGPWWGKDGSVCWALGWGSRACIGTEGFSSSICVMITGGTNVVFWEGRDSCKWKDSQLSPYSNILCATVSHPPSIFVQDLLLLFYS